MARVFIDMDGVLADFAAGYEASFGARPCVLNDCVDWSLVASAPGWYASLPPMEGMRELWSGLAEFSPIILSGCPPKVPESAADKRKWVRKHLGEGIEVRCVLSKEKALHCRPGDVLVDDWPKYRTLWLAAGGHWVDHKSAAESVSLVRSILA